MRCVRRCNISCPLYGCGKRYVAFQNAGACNALGLMRMYSMYGNMLCHCSNLTMLSWGASVAQATLSQSRHTSLPVHRCLSTGAQGLDAACFDLTRCDIKWQNCGTWHYDYVPLMPAGYSTSSNACRRHQHDLRIRSLGAQQPHPAVCCCWVCTCDACGVCWFSCAQYGVTRIVAGEMSGAAAGRWAADETSNTPGAA
jgi:hypothetical protein